MVPPSYPHSAAILRTGASMPTIGFGTFPLRGKEATEAVSTALALGYRHIDTAMRYHNEDAVGMAVAQSNLPRSEVFITTKLATDQVGFEREALMRSLESLALDYVDLWLMHWPPGGSAGVSSWRELCRAKEAGLVKAIGVSNYSMRLINELDRDSGTLPDVVQRSWSPVEYDSEFIEFCTDRGIALSAHSPIRNTPLDHPTLLASSSRHERSVPQVILRWNIQHGVAAVPKSSRSARMRENIDVFSFELMPEEMAAIDSLSQSYAR